MNPSTSEEVQTVVVLGASNVSLGWRALAQSVLTRRTGRVHLLTAHGMGRSYIAQSRFGWRSAPGILESRLWQTLNEGSVQPPSAALMTDLGNDLVYGRSVAEILDAAKEVISRLRQSSPGCPVVVTRPPLESVESLSALRYQFFRTVIFPFCKLSLQQAIQGTRELDQGIQALQNVNTVAPQREWFGLDPIHIRRSCRPSAFESFLVPWPEQELNPAEPDTQPPRRPQMSCRWVFGRQRDVAQPSASTARCLVSAW